MEPKFTDAQKKSFAHLRILKAGRASRLRKARIEKTGKTWYDKYWFRVYHIAHCLLRGRALGQIERMRADPDYTPQSVYEEKVLMDQVNIAVSKVTAGTFHEA